jgi:hypothetical protein
MNRHTCTFLAFAAVLLASIPAVGSCSGGSKKAKLTAEEVEQICVAIVSCDHAGGTGSSATVSSCVNDLMWLDTTDVSVIRMSDVIDCIVRAGSDCDALWRCSNEGHGFEACDDSTYTSHCEGTMQVECYDGAVHYNDCSRLDPLYGDAICVEDGGYLDCASARTCDPASSPPVCHGNTLEMCVDGTVMMVDCTLTGASCGELMPGLDYCIGRGAACTEEGSTTCEGTTVVRCLGGREARFDCASRLGSEFTCFQDVDGDASCAARGTQCDPEANADSCDATSVDYCRWGYLDSVDCTALGYATCAEEAGAAWCE